METKMENLSLIPWLEELVNRLKNPEQKQEYNQAIIVLIANTNEGTKQNVQTCQIDFVQALGSIELAKNIMIDCKKETLEYADNTK